MEYFRYLVRFIYRIRWYLAILPLLAMVISWIMTQGIDKEYNVKTTIYTGIISGYNIETGQATNMAHSNVNMSNLMHIITTERTLKNVSLRLLARVMTYGNEDQSNNYITAEHYRELVRIVPPEVKALIDKRSERKTVANLLAYERPSADNFVYGLLHYGHPYFSLSELETRIKVARLEGSDLIEIGYSANDPGIAYNTLEILNEEFISQYQHIRFGETDNVIKFFDQEVAKLYKMLTNAEDSLIAYNVAKRIINYSEQTKMVTIMDADHQSRGQELLATQMTAQKLADFYESQLGNQAEVIRGNNSFITELNNISRLKSRISNLELMNEGGNSETNEALEQARKELENAEKRIEEITQGIVVREGGIDATPTTELALGWLEQVVNLEKAEAEAEAMEIQRKSLDEDFLYFSPIGATINRKERHITFIEGNYMEMLGALNSARLRRRNLQMTTATLQVLNPPLFPLTAMPTNRLMILLATYVLSMGIVAGFFFIIELLDHTLRDSRRTTSITGMPVIGAYPKESTLRYRRFNKMMGEMALKWLSKMLLPYMKPTAQGRSNVVNIMSTEEKDGKSFIAVELEEYWTSLGLSVRRLTYDEDFLAEDSRYIMAQTPKDLAPDLADDEILIIEYPCLKEHPVPPTLLEAGNVNLVVTRANRTWKDTDQKALDALCKSLPEEKRKTLSIYLTNADRNAVEEFTGQLPPYTIFKNFIYKMSQLGLTSVEYKAGRN